MKIEELKSDAGRLLNRLLECDLISYAAYALIYDDEMEAIDAAYKIGKNENLENQKGAVNESENQTV